MKQYTFNIKFYPPKKLKNIKQKYSKYITSENCSDCLLVYNKSNTQIFIKQKYILQIFNSIKITLKDKCIRTLKQSKYEKFFNFIKEYITTEKFILENILVDNVIQLDNDLKNYINKLYQVSMEGMTQEEINLIVKRLIITLSMFSILEDIDQQNIKEANIILNESLLTIRNKTKEIEDSFKQSKYVFSSSYKQDLLQNEINPLLNKIKEKLSPVLEKVNIDIINNPYFKFLHKTKSLKVVLSINYIIYKILTNQDYFKNFVLNLGNNSTKQNNSEEEELSLNTVSDLIYESYPLVLVKNKINDMFNRQLSFNTLYFYYNLNSLDIASKHLINLLKE